MTSEQQTRRPRNEHAERLRAALAGYSQISADGEHFFDPEREIDAALNWERRHTVERIREKAGETFRGTLAIQWLDAILTDSEDSHE